MSKKRNWTRREFCKAFAKSGLAAGLFGLSGLSCESERVSYSEKLLSGIAKQKQPNIILIMSDDQGIGDVSLYGRANQTPNIDRIGKEGIKFTDFYVTSPICTPSRYSLLTGRYHFRAPEVFHNALLPKEPKHNRVHLPDDEITIADVLKTAGYKTALVGKWHLGHGSIEYGPNNHGFDEFFGFLPGCIDYYKHTYEETPALYRNKELVEAKGYSTDVFTDEAIRFIEANKSGPFFLYLPYNAPHYGRAPYGKLLQLPPDGPAHLPKETDWDLRVYKAMVANLDKNVGRVLDTLEKLKLEENTIVIFLSDNGGDYKYGGVNLPWKGQKGNLWDGGIRVPCVIRWKGAIEPGQQRKQLCVSFDLLPTLAHWAGASLPQRQLDGVDLYDIVMNNAEAPQRSIFFERKPKKQFAVRSNKWKYLKYHDEREFLFDAEKDPYERVSVFEENREQAKKMRADFEKFISSF